MLERPTLAPHRPPRPTTQMIGRTAELGRLRDALAHVPVAAIYGIGGVGKSTLAVAFAEHWPGAVIWSSGTATPTIEALTSEVFRQLGVAHYDLDAADAERVQMLADLIDRHRALLVLDDLHALDPEQRALLVAEIARGLRDGRMVATSRELVPMTVGDVDRLQLRLEPLDRAAAADLCGRLAALLGAGPDFEQIWEASRGNPFLIRQAHVAGLDAPNPLDDATARLAGLERAVAVALALCHAPLPHAVLARLAPDEPGELALQALATRLIADRHPDRSYAMHDLVRESLLRTASLDEQRAVRDRLIDALGDALRGRTGELVGLASGLAHQLRAAGRPADIAALLGELGLPLSRTGGDGFVLQELHALPAAVMTAELRVLHARTLCHWLQIRRAYELLSASPPSAPSARLVFGNVATWAGAWYDTEAIHGALAADPTQSPEIRARAEFGLAWVQINRGTWSASSADGLRRAGVSAIYVESLRLCDALLRESVAERLDAAMSLLDGIASAAAPREPWARLMLPVLIALVLARAGELDHAEQLLAWSESTLSLQRDRIEINNARAIVAAERGERTASAALLRHSVRLFDRGGFFAGRAWTRTALARVLYQLGRRREAAIVLDELRALCAAHGTSAYAPGIASAEHDDPLHPAWLEPGDPPPPAKRGDALRHRLRELLRTASGAAGDLTAEDLPPIEIPDGPDTALDRALAALAAAVLARRHGQPRTATQHLRRALAAASDGGVDAEVIPALYDALDHAAAAADPTAPDELVIDTVHHEVTGGGRRLSLASRPVLRSLLYAFAEPPEHWLSEQAIAQVLGQASYDPERHASTLKSNVRRLRELLRGFAVDLVREADGYRLVFRGRLRLSGART